MSTLSAVARDRSTYVVTATFADEDDAAATPTAITWTLTTPEGTVVNSRSAVSVPPSSSVEIVLSGADLDYDTSNQRVLTIEATYDSTLGAGLPLKDEVWFSIINLVAI